MTYTEFLKELGERFPKDQRGNLFTAKDLFRFYCIYEKIEAFSCETSKNQAWTIFESPAALYPSDGELEDTFNESDSEELLNDIVEFYKK